MMPRIPVAIVLSSLSVGGLAAEETDWFTGNSLFETCERSSGIPLCNGYIMGVVAGGQHPICFPQGVVSRQATDVVRHWLRDHPEKRHESASFLVIQALKEKLPCN
jgi:Rap1a immunity proteins